MSECNENYWDCTGARIACALSKQCTKPCEKPCDMGKLVKRTLLAARGSAASHRIGFIIFLVVIILVGSIFFYFFFFSLGFLKRWWWWCCSKANFCVPGELVGAGCYWEFGF